MNSFRAAPAVLALCAGIAATSQAAGGQTIWYVDNKATGPDQDGTTWCTAFLDLQSALATAQVGDEIRVGAGAYKPGLAGNRFATFTLRSGVALRGGYAGCGAGTPDARDYTLYPAVLSGDLLGNDGPNFTNFADNSYHIVTYDNPAATGVLLEGFTVSGGYANGADALTNQGGGIHIRQGLAKCMPGGPTIRDCIVENNWGAHHGAVNDHGLSTVIENCIIRNNYSGAEGGGLQIHSGSPTVRNCQFLNNKSVGQGGGAWVGFDTDSTCTGGSTAHFVNCRFEGNSADLGGGAYTEQDAKPTFTNCTFVRNTVSRDGAGVFNNFSNATFSGCLFDENHAASQAGAVYNKNCNPSFTGCIFRRNSCGLYAGAIRNLSADPVFVGCTFYANVSATNGGAFHNRLSSPIFDRCAFYSNLAESDGGALFNVELSHAVIRNSVLVGNISNNRGGGLVNREASNITIENCTLYGNSAPRFAAIDHDTQSTTAANNSIIWNHSGIVVGGSIALVARYCNIQGGFKGVGNIDLAPQFVDANGADDIVGTEDDDLRLMSASPGINVGDPAFSPAASEQDLGGGPRLAGCRVDMGAEETDIPQTAADFNDDKALDLADFANFQLCFLSPAQNPGWRDACVCVFDVDDSEFVDLPDYAQLPWAHGPCESNSACDDGEGCNGVEACVAGVCHGGTPMVCNDQNLCTIDACQYGACTYTTALCDDDEPCTDDSCDPVNGCLFAADDSNSCSDGDACNGVEYCAGGVCHAVSAPVCNDGKPCTDDICDPAAGCVNTPDDTNGCGDGNVCNGEDVCHQGKCLTAPGLECADDNPCTDDTCDPLGGCVFANNDANSCSDGDACNGEETCSAGTCVLGSAPTCDDENACTDDSCAPDVGCVFTANDENACSDGNVCTVGDACVAGECISGAVPDCSEFSSSCQIASCDPAAAEPNCDLTDAPDNAECDDASPCTTNDHCVAGQCGGEAVDCGSFDTQCATAACDANGAQGNCDTLTARPSGTPCDNDANACTVDECDLGGNCLYKSDVACSGPLGECDGGQSCDPATGACMDNADVPADTPCDADGNACTVDQCDGGGACAFVSDVACPAPLDECDGGQSCDPSSGECTDNAETPAETPCDLDGNACTLDQCDGSGTCAFVSAAECPGPANECDGGQTCEPSSGECIDAADPAAGTACNIDADLCTLDVCDGSGNCVLDGQVQCAASTGVCDGGQSCEPSTGECVDNNEAPQGTACDLDGNLCTEDTCDGAGTCVAGPECDVLPVCIPQIGCHRPGPP